MRSARGFSSHSMVQYYQPKAVLTRGDYSCNYDVLHSSYPTCKGKAFFSTNMPEALSFVVENCRSLYGHELTAKIPKLLSWFSLILFFHYNSCVCDLRK